MTENKIFEALNSKLVELTQYTIQFDNFNIDTDSLSIWIRPTFLPTPPISGGVMSNSYNRYEGLYQIDVFGKRNVGMRTVNDISDIIIDKFKKGTVILYQTINVLCTKAYLLSRYYDDKWYILPAIIEYQCDIEN